MSDAPEAADGADSAGGSAGAGRSIPADLLADFVDEGSALLDDIRAALDGIAQAGPTPENVNAAFRSMHTLKGTSGMLGLNGIMELAHACEDILHAVRDQSVVPGPELLAMLRQAVDKLGEALADVTAGGSDARAVDPVLVEQLRRAHSAMPEAETTGHTLVDVAPEQIPRVGQVLIDSGAVTVAAVLAAVERQRAGDTRRIGEILVGDGLVTQDQVLAALGHQVGVAKSAAQSYDTTAAVRVPVRILSDLADLTANVLEDLTQLSADGVFGAVSPAAHPDPELDPARDAVAGRIATRRRLWEQVYELVAQASAEVVQVRSMRASALWSAATAAVTDVTAVTGKQVRVTARDGDLVIDRVLAQALRDPLVHLVRNSVDHGIEAPDERAAAGKDPTGTIELAVRADGGALLLEVTDDGAGLDMDRIAGRALTNGHITIRQLAGMSSQEIIDLIFAPGFSTRDQVTTVSGRGVGLDVVRNNLASVNGEVSVETAPGRGTVFRLRVPLPD